MPRTNMAAQKKKQEKKQEKTPSREQSRRSLSSRFMNIDEGRKKVLKKIAGLLLAAFAIFTFLAIFSYLFTWKTDQSLLTDPRMMDRDVDVSNLAGKLGYKWALFLVSGCFGLGSFFIVYLLSAYSYRLFYDRDDISRLRTFLVSVSGAFVFSLILAYFSDILDCRSAFGGGLGGDCGEVVVAVLANLTGSIVTLIILLIFLVMWLLLVSGRFSHWLSGLGGKKTVPVPDPESVHAGAVSSDAGIDAGPDACGNDSVDDHDAVNGNGHEEWPVPANTDDAGEEPDTDEEPLFVENRERASCQFNAGPVSNTISDDGNPVEDDSENEDTDGQDDIRQEDRGLEVVKGDDFSARVTKDLPRIDVRDELEKYEFPPLSLLDDYASGRHEVASEELERNNNKIRATLLSYKIQVEKVTACVGPTVTLYKVVPAPGVKISAIKNLEQDIAMSLNAKGVRVVSLPDSVGIEVANDYPSIVPLKSMLNDPAFRESKAELPVAIGYTITQKVKVFDLADAPHLLVAGATKQGKSVGLNVIVTSLLYAKHPSELKFVFIDPKMVEFTVYSKLLKHYLAVLPDAADEEEEMDNAVIKFADKAEQVLRSLCIEMDSRYKLFNKAVVNNVKLYNDKYRDRYLLPTEGHHYMPYIVVVIDEYADLLMTGGMGNNAKKMSGSITNSIIRLAQKGRAAGIHVIIATQRPSVDVITSVIKANFPARIAFRTSSRGDSTTIIGSPGAVNLIGKGDMLYYSGIDSERIQCALISLKEIDRVTRFVADQKGYKKSYNTPYYLPPVNAADDENGGGGGGGMIDMQNLDGMFEEAAKLVVTTQQGSTSALQRKLGLGYARAGKIMDQLEAAGIVGPQEGSKPRQVLINDLADLEPVLRSFVG